MNPKIEKLPLSNPIELGEGPHWDVATQSLYFVDAFVGTIYKYNPITGELNSVNLPCINTSIIIPIEGYKNKFVVTSNNCELQELTWDGVSDSQVKLKTLLKMEETVENILNDGKCDIYGRLWVGSMAKLDKTKQQDYKGSMYSYSRICGLKKHFSGIGISNGLCWSHDSKYFYYIDTTCGGIDVFDCDLEKNEIHNRRRLFDLKTASKNSKPDGMTIDADGKLWVACFEDAKVLRIDPISQCVMYELQLPSYLITSVAFGGRNLDELFVTSGNFDHILSSDLKNTYPDYGHIFRITGLGIKGAPMKNFVM